MMKEKLESLIQEMYAGHISYELAQMTFKRQFIERALLENHGNQVHTARRLGIHRNTLTRQMVELGIERGHSEYEVKA